MGSTELMAFPAKSIAWVITRYPVINLRLSKYKHPHTSYRLPWIPY